MMRTFKSILLTIIIIIVSFILPGCYTQLSRPRVDTADEYQPTENEAVEEYYQDEGTPGADSSRDVYIYNYYPCYGTDYYDYWYWNYSPYRWGYMGPYPDYWWNPYGPWWTPGWYAGIYHYDYWWGGHHRYHDSYYWNGNRGQSTARSYERRPFDRRSIGAPGREERESVSQSSLAKPSTPTRLERPHQTLTTPERKDQATTPERKSRTVKDMVSQRSRSKTKTSDVTDNGKIPAETKERSTSRQPRVIKNPPRAPKSEAKPNIIEPAPTRSKPDASKKNSATPNRSSKQKSNSISRPSNSGNTQISKPSAPSYTPKSSNSGSSTRSTPQRSSSSPNRSSSGTSSKSSGSSRTSKK